MQKTYAPFIISSPDHIARFTEIQRQNPWWKMLLGISKVPDGFPRAHVGGRPVPVVFFAKGELTVYEREMDFRSAAPGANNGLRYEHINTVFSFDLPYSSIVSLERFQAPEPFMKHFNIDWIKISVAAPFSPPELLLSLIGDGLEMNKIKQANDTLFDELQSKLTK